MPAQVPVRARVAGGSAKARRELAAVAAVILLGAAAVWIARGRTAPVARDDSMVAIAAGDFAIGTDEGAAIARPRHTEHVAAFRIERTEVTVAAYQEFVAATRAPAPWSGAAPLGTLPVQRKEHPLAGTEQTAKAFLFLLKEQMKVEK